MGKYKHGAPSQEINLHEVLSKLDASELSLAKRCYVLILFYVGCRRTEPLAIKWEDIRVTVDAVFITIPAYKHGQRGGPVELPRDLTGVLSLISLHKKTKKGACLFPFSSSTAYRIIKGLFPSMSPHWFRHNRITKLRKKIDGKTISLDDAKSWTGIKSDATMSHYGMTTQEGISRVSETLKE